MLSLPYLLIYCFQRQCPNRLPRRCSQSTEHHDGRHRQSPYLNASTEEKVYAIAGPEFGEDEGKLAIIVRALYGLKSSGAAWRSHFAATLQDIGFIPSYAAGGDPDMWYQEAVTRDGFEYYEYVLVYVDDILCISEDPGTIIRSFADPPFLYRLKDVGPPTRYLGAKIG